MMMCVLATAAAIGADKNPVEGGRWEPAGPLNATVLALDSDPRTLGRHLAGTYFGGLYETTDDGATWAPIATSFSTSSVLAIAFDLRNGANVYAGTFDGGVHKSVDGGATWTDSSEGIEDRTIVALGVNPYESQSILALSTTHVYRSTDSAKTWTAAEVEILKGIRPRSLAYDLRQPGYVYVGTEGKGVLRSTDGGETWEPWNDGLGELTVNSLAFNKQTHATLYAATSQGYVFKLAAGATTWTRTADIAGSTGQIYAVQPHPATVDTLFAASNAGLMITRDDGASWSLALPKVISVLRTDFFGRLFMAADVAGGFQYTTDLARTWKEPQRGFQNLFVGAMAGIAPDGISSMLLAGTEHGVYRRLADQKSWTAPTLERRIFTLLKDPADSSTVFAGTEGYGVWKTNDLGSSWKSISKGMVPAEVYAFDSSARTPAVTYAATSSGVFRSLDHAKTWQPITELIVAKALSVSIDPQDSTIAYVGSLEGSVFRTSTGGLNFEKVSSGLPPREDIRVLRVSPILSKRVYAITSKGSLYVTDNSGDDWYDLRPGQKDALSLDIHPTEPWTLYLGTAGGGVLKSVSSGIDWFDSSNGIGAAYVTAIALDPSKPDRILAATQDRLYISDDGGLVWKKRGEGLPPEIVSQLVISPNDPSIVYALVSGRGIFASSDGGFNFAPCRHPQDAAVLALHIDPLGDGRLLTSARSTGVLARSEGGTDWEDRSEGLSVFVRGLAADPTNPNILYAGTLTSGVFKSVDHGISWAATGLADKLILQIKTDQRRSGTVYAATTEGVLRSTDGGKTWSLTGQKISFVFDIKADPADRKRLYASGSAGKLVRSDDGGQTWIRANQGLPLENILTLAIDDAKGILFAATQASGIYRSSDRGLSWQQMSTPALGKSKITKITVDNRTGAYYAVTNGEGLLICFDGKAWIPFNVGLPSLKITGVLSLRSKPGTLLAASSEEGLFRSDAGKPWTPVAFPGPSKYVQLLMDDSEGRLYLAADENLFRSEDDGTTWNRIGQGLPADLPVERLAIDPYNSSNVFAYAGNKIYSSADRGESFPRSTPVQAGEAPVNEIIVGDRSNQLLLATLGRGLIVSPDAGATWSEPVDPLAVDPFVLALVIDPAESSILYAGISSGVLRTADSGANWNACGGEVAGIGVLALEYDASGHILYAGTNKGVYASSDGCHSWVHLSQGMFHTNVTSLALDPVNPKVLYAGTEGGGVFRYARP